MDEKLFKKQGPFAEKKTRRRTWIPPDLKEVEALARRCLSEHQIICALGIDENTLSRKKRALRNFKEAVEKGRAQGNAAILSKLYDSALAGSMAAIKFYLKMRGNWSEKPIKIKTDAEEQLEEIMRGREETMKVIQALTLAERDQYLNMMELGKARIRDGIVVKRDPGPLPAAIAAFEIKDTDE